MRAFEWLMLMCAAGAAAPVQAAAPPPPVGPLEDVLQAVDDAVVHAAPAGDAPAAFQVAAGTQLTWVVQARANGFYRVIRRDRGPQGWVGSSSVRLVHEHPHGGDDPHACAAALDECPVRGCALPGSDEAGDNEIKRRRPAPGEPRTLTLDDFASLQREADARVGQGPDDTTPQQHAELRGLEAGGGTVSEGDRVRVVGYIARSGEGLHVNKSGESVNCLLKKPQDNDIHIPLVAHPDDTEYQGIVVEMIPQDRPQEWNADALQRIQARGAQVRVEGGLAYDKVHFVNADPAHPFKDEPERVALGSASGHAFRSLPSAALRRGR